MLPRVIIFNGLSLEGCMDWCIDLLERNAQVISTRLSMRSSRAASTSVCGSNSSEMAPSGQASTHLPQPRQRSCISAFSGPRVITRSPP